MKKNLLERMQRSNEYNRPEYVDFYGGMSVVAYGKRGGKKYTRNENIAVKESISDKVIPVTKPDNYKSDHLLSEDEKRLVSEAWPVKESLIHRLSHLWGLSE